MINHSKFCEVRLALFGHRISEPMERTRSTAAELGMLMLYLRKTSIQA